uniref:CSON012137 protein n=1 Tax=Culicoides sonorensis TaxID=179676 RepID=A0A336MGQ5_CULSO
MEKNKAIFSEFIRVYKNNPCLWDPKHPGFKSVSAKHSAYEQLLYVMKKFDPSNTEIDHDTVKKKINSMRACFRRDYRKVRLSGYQYKPQLWYYDLLLFVNESKSVKDEFFIKQFKSLPKEEPESEVEISYMDMRESQSSHDEVEIEDIYEANVIEEHLEDDYELQVTSQQQQQQQQHAEIITVQEDHRTDSEEKDDECSVFGKHIGMELQLMSERQRIIAKKLLSDIAYYGRLERLTEYTEIKCTKGPEAKE